MKRLLAFYYRRILSPLLSSYFRIIGVNIGKRVTFYGIPIVECQRRGQITIGDHAVLCSISNFTALGVSRRCVIRALTSDAQISIGANAGMSGVTICATLDLKIGPDVLIGSEVIIMDTDFHPVNPVGRRTAPLEFANSKPIQIEANVFVGARSMIGKGTHIGENAVIGMGSIMSSTIVPRGAVYRQLRATSCHQYKH